MKPYKCVPLTHNISHKNKPNNNQYIKQIVHK